MLVLLPSLQRCSCNNRLLLCFSRCARSGQLTYGDECCGRAKISRDLPLSRHSRTTGLTGTERAGGGGPARPHAGAGEQPTCGWIAMQAIARAARNGQEIEAGRGYSRREGLAGGNAGRRQQRRCDTDHAVAVPRCWRSDVPNLSQHSYSRLDAAAAVQKRAGKDGESRGEIRGDVRHR